MNKLLKLCYKCGFRIELEKDNMVRGVTVKVFDPVDHIGRLITIPYEDIENRSGDFEEEIIKEITNNFDINWEEI